MKKTTLTLMMGIFAAGSIFPTLSYADGPGHHDNGNHRGPIHHVQRAPVHHAPIHRAPVHHAPAYHGNPHHGHFSWQGHDFRRGHPLPARYRGHGYRVDDWRGRGLYEPPRGSYWSYINGNYVLVAAATGIITSIILNNALGN